MDVSNHKQFKEITSAASDHIPWRKTDDTAELLQLLIENAGAGIWVRDLVTDLLQLCPQSRRMLGLPDDHSGVMAREEWLKQADVREIERFQRWAKTPTALTAPYEQEFSSKRPDGEIRWLRTTARILLDQEGCPTRLVGLMFDDTDRKRAEDSLRESEEHLRLTQEAALIGSFVTDADGKIVGSRQFYRNLGLPEDVGALDRDAYMGFTHPDDRERVAREVSAAIQSGDGFDIECRMNRVDTGETRWVFTRIKFERADDGQLIRMVGAHLDITDRKRTEETLQESEDRLHLVQESALIGTFVTDADHRIVGSRQFYHNLGLPEDTGAIDSKIYLGFVHPGDQERVKREVFAAIKSDDSLDIEYRVNRRDTGEIRWIFSRTRYQRTDDGQLIRVVGAHLDITEHKLAEETMREAEERLGLTQEAALIGTFVIDADRRVVGSRQFYRNLGLPEDAGAIEGDVYLGLVHPDDREGMERELIAASAATDGFDIECRIKRADTGDIRWIFTRTKIECADDGQVIRIVGAHLDITDRKRAEEAVRESEERLHLVQDAALIGTFVTDTDRITIGSRQFYRNLGLPEDTAFISRETHTDLTHPDDRGRVQQETENSIQSADGLDIEYRIKRADTGELRWIFARTKYERADDGQLIQIVGVHLDITDHKRAEAALYESVALNQSMIEASADCVKLIGLDGRLQFMNKQGLAALEIEDGSRLLGRSWAELLPAVERPKVKAAIEAARYGQIGRFNAGCPTATGKPKWWDVIVTPICDEQGQPRQLLAISRDITEHRDQMAKIHWTASHDMLTELPNRRYFQSRLDEVLVRAAAQGANVGLLQLDVDDFKQTNDALGHDAGDALLKTFTQRLQGATQGNEMVARLGGDEFAIIVPNLTDSRPLSRIVEDIQAQLAEPFVYQGRVFDCRASIGEAIYPQHGETVDDLMKSTDIALYAAKTSGRGHVRSFHPSMRADMHKRLDMVDRARTALKVDLIFPYYQPKIDFRTGAPAGFEALLRWQDPNGRIQPPAAIAAAFEDMDVAQALSERMQLRVLADMRRWLDDDIDFGHVAINASAAEFRQNDFAERLLNRVRAAGVPTSQIELEVTETVFLGRGAEYVDRALHLLSVEGMRIALDDFGTGYASLSHLKQFPVDVIKIDQSFVRNINIDPDDSAIIKALIGLGKSLSIRIVAEGIETHAQSAFLAENGCDYGQGYLFSKAVAAAEVPELISSLNKGTFSAVKAKWPRGVEAANYG